MKRRALYLIVFVSVFTVQCKKQEKTITDVLVEQNTDKFTAYINGNYWEANIAEAKLMSDMGDRFYISADLVRNGTVLQTFFLNSIRLNNEKQKLYSSIRWLVFETAGASRGKDTAVADFYLSNYDVNENYYLVIDDEENYFQLEGYTKTSSVLKGRFQLTLYRMHKDRKIQTQNMPDTLRITDGRFEMKLQPPNKF